MNIMVQLGQEIVAKNQILQSLHRRDFDRDGEELVADRLHDGNRHRRRR